MFNDFGVPGVCRGESFVVRRPDNTCDDNYLDVTLVWGPYVLVISRPRWPHACHP